VIILAIDTASPYGSIAIRSQGQLVAERALESADGFAHVLFPEIERLLAESGFELKRIDRFAAASGPGSFTGVRVGLAAAKGLAEAMGCPAVGISNLQVLASFGKGAVRGVFVEARRGEVYAGVYDSALQPLNPEVVMPASRWLETLTGFEYEFIAPADNPFWSALEVTRFAHMGRTAAPKLLAGAVALCAERAEASDPALLDANYVRRSDAELFWKDA
jgi:tRNA threonylcarbamoyladenosine biosynthesis protein TsaB